MSKKDNTILAVVLGIITGAAITLLSTPKSGKEIREDIKVKTEDLPSDFKHILSETKELYSKMHLFLTEAASDKSSSLKKVWDQKAEKAKELIKTQQQRIEQAIDTTKNKLSESESPE